MNFEEWYQQYWRYGSGTDEARAQRAWVMARASLQPLVAKLVHTRANDFGLAEAAEFLVEAGKFYEDHPELEKQVYG